MSSNTAWTFEDGCFTFKLANQQLVATLYANCCDGSLPEEDRCKTCMKFCAKWCYKEGAGSICCKDYKESHIYLRHARTSNGFQAIIVDLSSFLDHASKTHDGCKSTIADFLEAAFQLGSAYELSKMEMECQNTAMAIENSIQSGQPSGGTEPQTHDVSPPASTGTLALQQNPQSPNDDMQADLPPIWEFLDLTSLIPGLSLPPSQPQQSTVAVPQPLGYQSQVDPDPMQHDAQRSSAPAGMRTALPTEARVSHLPPNSVLAEHEAFKGLLQDRRINLPNSQLTEYIKAMISVEEEFDDHLAVARRILEVMALHDNIRLAWTVKDLGNWRLYWHCKHCVRSGQIRASWQARGYGKHACSKTGLKRSKRSLA
eukprot:m.24169 g.24169  ORF g.24169 m.24169 type:complete len:371 (+) comp11476_c0_seq2:131-1243(+)